MKNKIYAVGIAAFLALWLVITGFCWFGPKQEISLSERRPLAQMPKLTMETLLAKDDKNPDGSVKTAKSFMSLFAEYAEDQFPLRDEFRQMKSLYQTYVMQQMDNNGYYVKNDYAAEIVYPLDNVRLDANISIMNDIYNDYLKKIGAKTYVSIVPDKGYYMAEQNGYLSLDYQEMFQKVQQGMSEKVTHIDITDVLSLDSYYNTDTHWRQEKILPVAQKIAEAMGKKVESAESYSQVAVEKPFYGVYYKFAALPMDPEQMYLMQSELLKGCEVKNPIDGTVISMYDMTKAESNELYDIFFSGNQPIMEITNTAHQGKHRELVVFGDSFARSMVPLLMGDYSKITVIDLRLKPIQSLDITMFERKDVLFLYSTLSLNKTITK